MSAPSFTTIQAAVAALIAGSSALNAYGAAILTDPLLDQETARSAVGARLRSVGVCIEIGFPWVAAAESHLDGATQIEAMIEVFTGEDPQVAHTLNRAALVNEVILAVTAKPSTPGQKPARLRSAESVKAENGMVLHMQSYFIPMTIKPSSSVSSPQV